MNERGTVDLGDRLGHRLHHVGAGMEEELHLGEALDVLRLDMVDAADVEEVVLVMEGEQPFHLRRVHAAVRLDDIDDRQIEIGEDVDLHPGQRQAAADQQARQRHHDRDGVPQRENKGIH